MIGLTLLAGFVVSVIVSLACIRFGPTQQQNARSSHQQPTAIAGGLAIMAAMAVVLLSVNQTELMGSDPRVGLLAGLLALNVVLGLTDDIFELRASLRFLLLAMAAMVWITVLPPIRALTFAGDFSIPLSQAAYIACASIFLLGFTNFVNFMDGANGLVGGSGFIAFLALSVLSFVDGQPTITLISLSACAGLAGFLIVNLRPKARIFMGDTGSLPLGFGIAALLVWLVSKSAYDGMVWIAGMIVAPLITDALLTLAWRLKHGHNLAEAHRHHAYQRWIRAGRSHMQVALDYGLQSLACAGLAILVYFAAPTDAPHYAFAGLCAASILLSLRWMKAPWPDREKPDQ